MQIILLSGGSGKRLWPLSNESRSKQFLRLLPSPDGGRESMVQRVYDRSRNRDFPARLQSLQVYFKRMPSPISSVRM
ncbi:sugar phosphate nucleotidyltransferase [Parabacteroides merdae]|nr:MULTISPECIES: sugar phosphate nucleotidyltransferase [Bacteroidales]MDR3953059.1 sugar phosphate nucleotidyltransferase [Bacteroides sp.]MDB1029720.1 sugar phosphate nucleotidyltransferase [Phocaeicola vulgatus]MDB1043794.1 sugar phosphate nucleotidyltransferase [Phocaeicola vulgatus]MDB8927762.1 sugar phosphate nucleotidyltransferase [Parabacteroides merdae]MDB8932612.1 sugar phosphate nucleotidyltransferase [Parabacteroides merdae]